MLIPRKNSSSSYEVVFEDTDDRQSGIYLVETKENTKTGKSFVLKTYISTLAYIQQRIKAEECIYYKVIFHDGTDLKHRYIKQANLFDDSMKNSEDIKELINRGLIIENKCKSYFVDFLKCQSRLVVEIQGTDRTGWHPSGHYITDGLSTTNDIIFTGRSSYKFKKKGSKEQYYVMLKKIFSENSLVYAICSYAVSSLFLGLLTNEINQALSLNGTSSKGKSTVGKLALSMLTTPQAFFGLDSTKGNIQSILKHANHAYVFFDEVAENNLKLEERKNLVYALANGTEKGRLNKSAISNDYYSNLDPEKDKLKYTVLIAGERSFLEGIPIEGTGIDARYIEIVLPSNTPLWDSINNAEEAEHLNQFIHENYGHIADEFLSLIKKNADKIPLMYQQKLSAIREEIPESTPIVKRKVRILAYSYISAYYLAQILFGDEYATEYAEQSYLAFKNAIIEPDYKNETDLYKEALSHVRSTLDRHIAVLDSMGNLCNTGAMIKKLGFMKSNDTFQEISISSESFPEFCILLNLDKALFLKYLEGNNLLVSDKDRKTKKIMVDNHRANYYVIRIPHKFFEEPEKETSSDEKSGNLLDIIETPWDK